MKYDALGKSWDLSFPFSVQRDLEEKYGKGFYGICRMIAPNVKADVDLERDPTELLNVIGDVRVGVLVDMLQAGTKGMDEETAIEVYEDLGLVPTFTLIFRAINPSEEVEEDAPRPPKKKTRTKKRAG